MAYFSAEHHTDAGGLQARVASHLCETGIQLEEERRSTALDGPASSFRKNLLCCSAHSDTE